METFFEALFNAFLLGVYILLSVLFFAAVGNAFKLKRDSNLKGDSQFKAKYLIILLIMLFFLVVLYSYLDGAGAFPDWDKGWSPSRDGWP